MKFDDLDIFYLANELSPIQLRHEAKRINEYINNRDIIYSMPCCLLWSRDHEHLTPDVYPVIFQLYDFDFEGYLGCVREALKWQANSNTSKETPPPGRRKRIDIDSLKARLDIVTEVERYTQLRKSGNNRFVGICPMHTEKSPSFTVYADTQTWHCFGACNRGGDVIDFIMAVEGVDFRDAAAMLGAT